MQSDPTQGLHRPVSPRFALTAPSVPGRVVPMQSFVPASVAPPVPASWAVATGVTSAFALCVARWQPLHRWSLCIGGHGRGAGAACWFVPERNQHQGADGHCRVDDRGENPCRCGAVPDGSHQIAQRQEAHGECADADGRNSADRPAVNPCRTLPPGRRGRCRARRRGERWEAQRRHRSG